MRTILLFTVGLIMVVLLMQNGDAAPCNGKGRQIDPCKALGCLNGGTCATDHEGIARCTCVEGFFGQNCKIDCRTPGYTYFSSVERCFKFYNVLEERDVARSRCASENASLVVVDSYEKDMIVKKYLFGEAVSAALTMVHTWLGLIWLSGNDKDSKWQWVDSQLLQNTYQNWDTIEPVTSNGKYLCVGADLLVFGVLEEFNWHTRECQDAYYSICEKQ